MKVIVIAAGKGKRISNEFKEIPKALIPINGKTIFEKQKYVFESNNISEFIVITGPKNKFEDKEIKIIQDFENQNQFMALLKNLSIAGGLLIIASNEPKICTLDYYLKSKQS